VEISQQEYSFEFLKLNYKPLKIVLNGSSKLSQFYITAKNEKFIKKTNEEQKTIESILFEIKSRMIKFILICDEKTDSVLSIPNDNKTTIEDFVKMNPMFFRKSRFFTKTTFRLHVLDEQTLQCIERKRMEKEKNKEKYKKMLAVVSRYTKCTL
jgi:uncharacterized protein with NRDE domain